MTLEVLTVAPGYTVGGVGPYTVPHPYRVAEDLLVSVRDGASIIPLLIDEDYTVTPASSSTAGSLSLTSAAALEYVGWTLGIERFTAVEQGWEGLRGPREKGLERQLDLLAMALQDQGDIASRALRLPAGSPINPRLPALAPGRTVMVDDAGGAFAAGPTASEIAVAAQGAADILKVANLVPRVIWTGTVASMLALDVSQLVNGQQVSVRQFAAGEFGGGVFVLGPSVAPNGGTEIAHGATGQSWFRLDRALVSAADFGGNAGALNAYTSALIGLTDAAQYGVVLHPGRGLSMLEFMASAGPFVDQRAALQAAIDKLMSSNVYSWLDLCGRTWTIGDQISVDADLFISAFHLPKIVANGKIICDAALWPTVGKGAFLVWRSSGSTAEIQRLHFQNVHLDCSSIASGIDILGSYRDIKIRWCGMRNAKVFGVRHRFVVTGVGTSGNLRLEYNDIESADAASVSFSARTLFGFDLEGAADSKILGNRVQGAKTAVRAAISSALIAHNHFFQGISNPGAGNYQSDINPLMELPIRSNSVIVHNYLDNGYTRFTEGLFGTDEATSQGYALMAFNIHTMAYTDENACFVQFRPKTASCVLSNFKCVLSQFRVIGGTSTQKMLSPFRVSLLSGGSWATADCYNSDITDNYFWGDPGIVPQSTHIRLRHDLVVGSTSYPVDLTGRTPFGIQLNYLDAAPGIVSSTGSYGCAWYDRTSAYVGAIKLATGVNGQMLTKFNVNKRSQFDA